MRRCVGVMVGMGWGVFRVRKVKFGHAGWAVARLFFCEGGVFFGGFVGVLEYFGCGEGVFGVVADGGIEWYL